MPRLIVKVLWGSKGEGRAEKSRNPRQGQEGRTAARADGRAGWRAAHGWQHNCRPGAQAQQHVAPHQPPTTGLLSIRWKMTWSELPQKGGKPAKRAQGCFQLSPPHVRAAWFASPAIPVRPQRRLLRSLPSPPPARTRQQDVSDGAHAPRVCLVAVGAAQHLGRYVVAGADAAAGAGQGRAGRREAVMAAGMPAQHAAAQQRGAHVRQMASRSTNVDRPKSMARRLSALSSPGRSSKKFSGFRSAMGGGGKGWGRRRAGSGTRALAAPHRPAAMPSLCRRRRPAERQPPEPRQAR